MVQEFQCLDRLRYNMHRRIAKYSPGDLVMVRVPQPNKTCLPHAGPFEVVQQRGNAVEITGEIGRMKEWINLDRLKPYSRCDAPLDLPSDSEDEEDEEPEATSATAAVSADPQDPESQASAVRSPAGPRDARGARARKPPVHLTDYVGWQPAARKPPRRRRNQ